MQVAKWGNSLAVRLPAKLVQELGLKAGDEIQIIRAEPGLAVSRQPSIRAAGTTGQERCRRLTQPAKTRMSVV